jgi:hypothetical protein
MAGPHAALALDVDSAAKATYPRWYAFWVPSNAGLCVVIARLREYPERVERDHADARPRRPIKRQRGVQSISDLCALMVSSNRDGQCHHRCETGTYAVMVS